MGLGGLIIEALSRLDMVDFFSQVEVEPSADQETEFLSAVRFVLFQHTVRRKNNKKRLHLVLLG